MTTDANIIQNNYVRISKPADLLYRKMSREWYAVGKTGVHNISVEQSGEETMQVFTAVCQRFWKHYKTISLISHPGKVMLKIIQNHINTTEEELSTKG